MVKKIFSALMTIAACIITSSCGTAGQATGIAALDGEWDITQAGNVTIDQKQDMELPFIGFSCKENRVYGNTSCNSLTGILNADAKQKTIDFSTLGSTKMMCHDMNTEQAVLEALAKARKYNIKGDNTLILENDNNQPVMTLKKRTK
ncbi:MAG: META domain-containing protein [Prevotella sp.]|nr:META domain-containing protein [Prevotella sp.]MEE1092549.1 META domain-containing protein [Prevotella sp.]